MKAAGVAVLLALTGCSWMSMPRNRGGHPAPDCVASDEAPILDVAMTIAVAAASAAVYEGLECRVEPCIHLERVALVPAVAATLYGVSAITGFRRVDACRSWRASHPSEVQEDDDHEPSVIPPAPFDAPD